MLERKLNCLSNNRHKTTTQIMMIKVLTNNQSTHHGVLIGLLKAKENVCFSEFPVSCQLYIHKL